MINQALIVFLKYPEPGKVKTRLAKTIGIKKAASFSRQCTERLLNRLNRQRPVFIFFTNADNQKRVRKWLGPHYHYLTQEGPDLGARMVKAFSLIFAKGFQQAVLCGTDIPELDKEIIEDAFQTLAQKEVVLGPSTDGGYYLIGLQQPQPQLFNEINWSTAQVMDQTLKQINRLKLTWQKTATLTDVDTMADLEYLNKKNTGEKYYEKFISFST